jgi:diaminopimelate epimerase
MNWNFTKMQGCGNDYIYFNCLERHFTDPERYARLLSDRHLGIGGDGIVLIAPSDKALAFMRMYNANGSEGKMCGNAIRCVAKYLYDNAYTQDTVLTIETLSGIKTLHLTIDPQSNTVESVCVDMGKALILPSEIPVNLPGQQGAKCVVARTIHVGEGNYEITCVSMGNPHAVVFMDGVDELNLTELGPLFENHPIFPEGVNTEFVRVLGKNSVYMRVWERGTGETLACGTGACAAVVAAVLNRFCPKAEDVTVRLLGGSLTIKYTEETVFMTGGCETVYEGEINLDKL